MSEKKKGPVTVNLDVVISDVKGEPHKGGQKIGEVIADFFCLRKGGNARKQWQWALALGEGKEIILDRVDFDEFKKLIDNENEMLVNMIKAQAMEIILAAEKKADEPIDEP